MARFLWTQKQDIGPSPRQLHAMAYDSKRNVTVLFGGIDQSQVYADTWEWDGAYWTQKSAIGPPARHRPLIVYDAVREKVIMHGGFINTTPITYMNDTWEWNGNTWTQLNDSGPARANHSMAFDDRRGCIVLFGGQNEGRQNDTWECNDGEWTQVAETGPSARMLASMSYDFTSERIVLFSGRGGTNDTWEWNGIEWTKVSDIGPSVREYHRMASFTEGVVLYGGQLSTGSATPSFQFYADTWQWNGKLWTQRQDIGPGPRAAHEMAFDRKRSCIVLFGGWAVNKNMGDTWELLER